MLEILKQSINRFSEDRCTILAASLAYYTIFSLPPMLFILVTTLTVSVGWYYGDQKAEDKAFSVVQQHVSEFIGNKEAEKEVGSIMRSNRNSGSLGWKSLLSLGGVLIAATGVVVALQTALNVVWRIKPDPEISGWKNLIVKRLLSLLMILALGLVLLLSFVVGGILDAVSNSVTNNTGWQTQVAAVLNFVVTFLIVTFIFAAIFKFMPDAHIAWKDVWVGSLVTAVLFAVGRIAMSLYFSYSSPGQQLGAAAGSLVILLIWVYYSSLIVLLGAEFTQAYIQQQGRLIRPESGSVKFFEQTEAAE